MYVVLPLWLQLLRESFQHVDHSSIPSFNLSIALRVIWGSPGGLDTTQLMQSLEQVVFKFRTLVMVQLLRKTKSHDELVEDFVTSCPTFGISGWINLHKPCEVIYQHQQIFVTTNWFVQLEKINWYKFKGVNFFWILRVKILDMWLTCFLFRKETFWILSRERRFSLLSQVKVLW